MKIPIEEISHIAALNTDFIKKIDIVQDKVVGIRFSYLPAMIRLRFLKFEKGAIVFEAAGGLAARKVVPLVLGYLEGRYADALSGVLSVSGDQISIRINEFIRDELPEIKGIQLNDFDITGKEISIHLSR